MVHVEDPVQVWQLRSYSVRLAGVESAELQWRQRGRCTEKTVSGYRKGERKWHSRIL